MKTGIEMIAAERERQVSAEGWTSQHDDEHDCMELASAAACYLDYYIDGQNEHSEDEFCPRWPWEQSSWKPEVGEGTNSKIRNLTKAGALIAAEIDRLRRSKVEATPAAMPPHLQPGPMALGIARGLSYEEHKREFYGELENLKTLIREEVLDEIYNQHGQNTELIERVRAAVSGSCAKCAANGWNTEVSGPCPKYPNCAESFPQNE